MSYGTDVVAAVDAQPEPACSVKLTVRRNDEKPAFLLRSQNDSLRSASFGALASLSSFFVQVLFVFIIVIVGMKWIIRIEKEISQTHRHRVSAERLLTLLRE